MVPWDNSLPSSRSTGFPNKVAIPCPNTSSLNSLACHVVSSMSLDSIILVHFELEPTNSGHVLKPIHFQELSLPLSRPIWPALWGSNFKSHSEDNTVWSHLSCEKCKENEPYWAALSHLVATGGCWALETCLVQLRCVLSVKYALDFRDNIFFKVSYLINFYIKNMLITFWIYWVYKICY